MTRRPHNERAAREYLSTIETAEVRELVRHVYGKFRVQYMLAQDSSTAPEAILPEDRDDMLCLVRVLHQALQNTDFIERVLSGETLAEATDWE